MPKFYIDVQYAPDARPPTANVSRCCPLSATAKATRRAAVRTSAIARSTRLAPAIRLTCLARRNWEILESLLSPRVPARGAPNLSCQYRR